MTRTPIFLLAFLLLVAASAAAQPGPAPGYDDPLVYAQDHAEGESAALAADPAGYAAQKASVGALSAEAAHSAYIACWTAYHHAQQSVPGCELFFTPPQQGAPLPEEGEGEPQEVQEAEDAAEEIEDATAEFAEEAQDIAEDIVEDPTSAPDQLDRIRDAVFRFVDRIVTTLAGIGQGAIDTVLGIVGGLGLGIGAVGFGLGAGVDGLLDTATAGAGFAADTTLAGGDALVALADGIQDGVASAGAAAGHGLDATSSGLQGAGGAVTDAVQAVGSAVGDAFDAVVDTVSGWFDGGQATQDLPVPGEPDDLVHPDGLLDGVFGLLD